MKKYEVTFHVTRFFNGGMREFESTKTIEARNLKSATNKARKMEVCGAKARTMWLVKEIKEIA